jgi:hypothetical protein
MRISQPPLPPRDHSRSASDRCSSDGTALRTPVTGAPAAQPGPGFVDMLHAAVVVLPRGGRPVATKKRSKGSPPPCDEIGALRLKREPRPKSSSWDRVAGLVDGSPEWNELAATAATKNHWIKLSDERREIAERLNIWRWLELRERAGAERAAVSILDARRTIIVDARESGQGMLERLVGDVYSRTSLTKKEREQFEQAADACEKAASAAHELSFKMRRELRRQQDEGVCTYHPPLKEPEADLEKDRENLQKRIGRAMGSRFGKEIRTNDGRTYQTGVSAFLPFRQLTTGDLSISLESVAPEHWKSAELEKVALNYGTMADLFHILARVVVGGRRKSGRKPLLPTRQLLSWAGRVGVTQRRLAELVELVLVVDERPAFADFAFEDLNVRGADLSSREGRVACIEQHFANVRKKRQPT